MRARRKGNSKGPDARQNEYQITLSADEVRGHPPSISLILKPPYP